MAEMDTGRIVYGGHLGPIVPNESLSDRIRRRAYQIWEAEGCPEGKAREHWLRAERELTGAGGEGDVKAMRPG